MPSVYLDSSALAKRYVAEKGSDDMRAIYERSNSLRLSLSFSVWNIGEAIGVIDQYQRKGWLTKEQLLTALANLAGETLRLSKIEALNLVPIDQATLSDTWDLVRRHHLYQADALQIVSSKAAGAETFVSADAHLLEAAKSEGLSPVDIEDHGQVVANMAKLG